MNHEIASLTQSFKEDLVQFLRDIVAIPSMSGQEEQVVQRIKQEMETLEYDKVWIDPLGNLIGQMGTGDRKLVFDGHCDTVNVGNLENWRFDPFQGASQDGIIFGRGASDQKGGLASAIYAGKVLKTLGMPDDLSFIVTASVLEENYEGLSWKTIIEENHLIPDAVVLTEPSNMTLKIGQRGRMEMKVHVNGVSCHGSNPELGDNAIYKISPIIQDIKKLNRTLSSDSILGKGSVTVTEIKSAAPSLCAVPDSATIHLDRRVTTGETLETCLQEITQLDSVKSSGAVVSIPEYSVKSYTGLTLKEKAFVPLWLMDQNHALVQTGIQAFQSQLNQEPQVGVWKFSTNGVTTKGVYDIPSIGFGPGNEEQAHAPNEHIPIQDLLDAAAFYAALAYHWMKTS